jgi:hypothetical protein
MEEQKTLEQQVVDTILQRKTTSLEIDGRTYEIPAPTPATIMLVSEETSKMPLINKETKSIFLETLRTARDCKAIGRIAAILVLGAKRIRENHQVVISETKKWSWRHFRFTKHQEETMSELDFVAMRIMEDITPETLNETITKRLMEMQLGDFFGLTTSLSEINTLARTKEVEQTAHGQ